MKSKHKLIKSQNAEAIPVSTACRDNPTIKAIISIRYIWILEVYTFTLIYVWIEINNVMLMNCEE